MKSAELFNTSAAPLPAVAKPKKRGSKTKDAEEAFHFHVRSYGLPEPARQWPFAKKAFGRRWLFDFAFLDYKLAVEIEGLVIVRAYVGGQVSEISLNRQHAVGLIGAKQRMVSMGRHANVDGFREDCRKYAAAVELGWQVIRFEQTMVRSREAIETTMRCLIAKGWKNPGSPP